MAEYKWYVEPGDDFTNESIATVASEWGLEVTPRLGIECADGKRRNLWEGPHTLITALRHSQHPFKFIALVQEGNGQIRRYQPKKKKETGLTTARGLM